MQFLHKQHPKDTHTYLKLLNIWVLHPAPQTPLPCPPAGISETAAAAAAAPAAALDTAQTVVTEAAQTVTEAAQTVASQAEAAAQTLSEIAAIISALGTENLGDLLVHPGAATIGVYYLARRHQVGGRARVLNMRGVGPAGS